MDPDTNLEEQLQLARTIAEGEGDLDDIDPLAAHELAELVLALDEWINKGGFLPKRWRKESAS